MSERYVTDTNSVISYFKDIFREAPNFDRTKVLSSRAKRIIEYAVNSYLYGGILLVVPSVVFIEIYDKWLDNEEFARKFYWEVFIPLRDAPNVQIRSIDREILENLVHVRGVLSNHDMHDKLVVASALALDCPIITTDGRIREYVESEKTIPEVIY